MARPGGHAVQAAAGLIGPTAAEGAVRPTRYRSEGRSRPAADGGRTHLVHAGTERSKSDSAADSRPLRHHRHPDTKITGQDRSPCLEH
jgi:hypothetical protein